jgi:hypothetical protein
LDGLNTFLANSKLKIRNKVRAKVIETFRKILLSQDLHKDVGRLLGSYNAQGVGCSSVKYIENPYVLDEKKHAEEAKAQQKKVIFITGRFRSGSTTMWNVFRQLPDTTAYYEPFNERRWFDASLRGEKVDGSHRGVSDYWAEYAGLEKLADYYDESWCNRNLYMDATSYAPQMKSYIDYLIEKAKGTAVLQFNRIDFRLAWIKHNYPDAKILHVYRNPRDQWVSSLWKDNKFTSSSPVEDFVDHFYLNDWREDLVNTFPMLEDKYCHHPYEVFYCLWRLSFIFGSFFSDISLSLESLVLEPKSQVDNVISSLNFDLPRIKTSHEVIEKVRFDKWKSFADGAWFSKKEDDLDKIICDFF